MAKRKLQLDCVRVGMTTIAVALLVVLGAGVCSADVWGVKSKNIVGVHETQPPSVLYRVYDSSGSVMEVGTVRLDGEEIDVDALAMDTANNTLYGYQLVYPEYTPEKSLPYSSWLITIDTVTAEATRAGSALIGTNMRGAVITADGRFLALDANSSRLVEINPSSGVEVSSVALTDGSNPVAISQIVDLSSSPLGLILVDKDTFYLLDETTGVMTYLDQDILPLPDGESVGIAGLAPRSCFNGFPSRDLYAYEVYGTDDIVSYDSYNGFVRTQIEGNIIPAFNAGCGDLAKVAITDVGGLFGRCIDFETIPDRCPHIEGDDIADQWDTYPWRVRFRVDNGTDVPAALATVGTPVSAFQGPVRLDENCVTTPTNDDMPAADQGVGCYFLTDDSGTLNTHYPIHILFSESWMSMLGLKGDILDIDDADAWLIEAYDQNDFFLSSLTIDTSSPRAGSGLATPFVIYSPDPMQSIRKVTITFVGEPNASGDVGFAVDNLCMDGLVMGDLDSPVGTWTIDTNDTGQTAYDLTYILAGNVDVDAECGPFQKMHITQGVFGGRAYTLVHWDSGCVAPGEDASTHFLWNDLSQLRDAWWTDDNGSFIAPAGLAHDSWFSLFRPFPIDPYDIRYSVANLATVWMGERYPPDPDDGMGPAVGPILIDNFRWTVTQTAIPRENMNSEIFEDSTYVWQTEPSVALDYGDSAVFDFSKPGGFEDDDILTLSYKASHGSLVTPRIIQVPYSELLAQVSAVPEEVTGGGVPGLAYLEGAVPNPFNPSTEIRYHLERNAQVEVKIYSLAGRLVDTLIDGVESAGSHTVRWNGRDKQGRRVASGVYLCHLKSAEQQDTLKIVLLK